MNFFLNLKTKYRLFNDRMSIILPTTKILINSGAVKKDNIRFFLGYTGWDPNQLEEEMESSSWIAVENQYKNKIIGKVATDFWKEKLQELGGEYLLWANAPENPLWN